MSGISWIRCAHPVCNPVDRHLLCHKHGQKALCPKYLPAFQKRFGELKRIRLR